MADQGKKPDPKIVETNAKELEKMLQFFLTIKSDSITPSTKDNLDSIQILLGNILGRNSTKMKLQEVKFTEKQMAVFKMVLKQGETKLKEAEYPTLKPDFKVPEIAATKEHAPKTK